ncbi:MAG: 23S rRNA (adenine(1618)-N(6))-methyltransferase RlmF [Cryobacterium sp.]|nr:23S rRNA (adenine(1618)-N(6))-methyltransferase RlmF [Oligoflexia bacterium]
MHPRNRHTGHYEFEKLVKAVPELKAFVIRNPSNEMTIDFANPSAVKTLNQALMKLFYGIREWNIPEGYLCPPVPGRSDYIHSIADLLASCHEDQIPRGDGIRVLDIGVGANGIYPLIGRSEYGWSFVGSDIDPEALDAVAATIEANDSLRGGVELRHQTNRARILRGVIDENEEFDLVMTNPPFHESLEAARGGSERKWKNLGREIRGASPVLNFGGQGSELWCEGGEVEFIRTLIDESRAFAKTVFIFSALVSREIHLPALYQALERANVDDVETIEMTQGQKKSRILAWTFLSLDERDAWMKRRW